MNWVPVPRMAGRAAIVSVGFNGVASALIDSALSAESPT